MGARSRCRGARRAAAAAWMAASLPLQVATGCRPPPARAAAPTEVASEPRWQDALAGDPELLVALRPGALRRHAWYGPLLRGALELARRHSRVVAATRAIEAVEDADEVIVAVPSVREQDVARDDVMVAAIGVRADVDPATLVDGDGEAIWSPGPIGPVRELVRAPDRSGETMAASLFELPGRTWVIVAGDLRARARDAFGRPSRSRPPPLDPATQRALAAPLAPDATGDADDGGWLAFARLDGPSFVRRVPALRPPAALAPIGHAMTAIALRLRASGAAPLEVLVSYANPVAAEAAERAAVDALEALRRSRQGGFSWLVDATVSRPAAGTRVAITAPLPSSLAERLAPAASSPHPPL